MQNRGINLNDGDLQKNVGLVNAGLILSLSGISRFYSITSYTLIKREVKIK